MKASVGCSPLWNIRHDKPPKGDRFYSLKRKIVPAMMFLNAVQQSKLDRSVQVWWILVGNYQLMPNICLAHYHNTVKLVC